MMESRDVAVSIVIATYNSAEMLDRCLAAIEQSTEKPLEYIVVLDGCTDRSKAVARRRGAKVIAMRERSGPAKARNLGVARARGDVIFFLDSDVCVRPDAVAKIVAHFRERSVDAVIGSYDDKPAEPGFVSQYRNLLHCFTHQVGHKAASTFWCGCGAVRRDLFVESGGLDERFDHPSVEDIEFGVRIAALGRRIVLDPTIQVQHLKRWTFFNMVKTDVVDRGIPWTRLMLRSSSVPNDLNVRWSQRACVALTPAAIVLAVLGYPLVSMGILFALIALNSRFYAFLAARRGPLFALRAAPLLLLFHLYCGIALAAGIVLHFFAPRKRPVQGLSRQGVVGES